MASFDLCVVASRRPDLLAVTLQSFSDHFFSRCVPARVFVNLDPIFGSEDDHRAVVSIVRARFSAATVFEPATAGFGAAVKRLWSATQADYVFHLEDDWVANFDISQDIFNHFDDRRIQQVSFHRNENWDFRKKGRFHKKKNYLRLMGVKLPIYTSMPQFTTSPSILRGEFARAAASLMDPARDPEKQFYSSVNIELERFAKPFRNYVYSPSSAPVIRDIGIEWREARGIQKIIRNATSTWESAP
ncbi:hypothetical protein [Pleomorphomonas carboxyditropha]|uniref:Glycosyltransferase 2-like domain-containing protein n=1 Tax=Pleomorphomonas carboxyditropha TaxID=2023338 RepID=A0A2G9WP97_9HYPH|nr:hypothetical protein [Pleomorphomonas carboxyditropha]PIO96493.1 hypothetical protein CJ014_25005 [Pleomorphomonas carboxyditropha]